MTYPILDVSDWQEDENEYGTGERVKKWVNEPGTKRIAMVKFPREDRGEHWAEKLCSEFAKILGYPCADVELSVHNGSMACLSYFFVNRKEGYAHYDGLTYFPEGYDEKRNEGYNFQLIESVLAKYGLIEEFLFVVVFDALVGEGDRHQNNWGLTRHETSGKLSISPLYDNSASLCRDIKQEKANDLLASPSKLLLHIHRSRSKMGWKDKKKEKHFSLVRNIYRLYPDRMKNLLRNLAVLTDQKIRDIVERLPDLVISLEQKELVIQYVISRRNILNRIGESMERIPTELMMIWKDPASRQRFVVGQLKEDIGGNFTFRYVNPELDEAIKHGFQNHPSFPDLKQEYVSEGALFSAIANRLPRQKRPDYALILQRYGVDPSSTEMEILEATRGRIPTDTFEFIRCASYAPGQRFTLDFEIAGTRHYDIDFVSLKTGSKIRLISDRSNLFDPYAVQVKAWEKDVLLGFVPKYYSQAVTNMLENVVNNYEAMITHIDISSEISDEMITMRVSVHV